MRNKITTAEAAWLNATATPASSVLHPQTSTRKSGIEKKKANSRFTNSRVRDQWGGSSGMRPMVYRWPLVQSYVSDMAAAVR